MRSVDWRALKRLSIFLLVLGLASSAISQRRSDPPPSRLEARPSVASLQAGAKLEFDVGDVSAGYSVAYISPPNMAGRKVKWDVSKVRGATAVIFQVSRTPFGRDGNPDYTPRGVVSQSREHGTVGASSVSVGQIATEAGFQPPSGRSGRTLSQPDRRQSFLAAGGQFTIYLRVVPIASTSNPVPVGLASPVLQIIYAKAPPSGFNISIPSSAAGRKRATPIECLSLEYTPFKEYCFVHPNPSVCSKVGQAKPWYEQAASLVVDAWDWTAQTYQKAKSAVVDIAASALPFVPREAFEYALDGALAACGVPPNIPNLDQLMEHGADYLAGEVVAQLGPPAGGEFAKDQIKKAILSGAKEAKKQLGNAGSDTPCQYKIDWPYLIAVLRNKSSAPVGPLFVGATDWTGTYATNDWNGRLFKSYGQSISHLNPGASLPVYIPLMPDMHQKKHYDQGVHKLSKYWSDYNSLTTDIEVSVSVTYDPGVSALSAKTGKRGLTKPFKVSY